MTDTPDIERAINDVLPPTPSTAPKPPGRPKGARDKKKRAHVRTRPTARAVAPTGDPLEDTDEPDETMVAMAGLCGALVWGLLNGLLRTGHRPLKGRGGAVAADGAPVDADEIQELGAALAPLLEKIPGTDRAAPYALPVLTVLSLWQRTAPADDAPPATDATEIVTPGTTLGEVREIAAGEYRGRWRWTERGWERVDG